MKWIEELGGPTGVAPADVKKEALEEFIKRFNLTSMMDWNLKGYLFNPNQFMKGTNFYNNGGKLQTLFPVRNCYDHLSAYKDDDQHVIVVSQPYGYKKDEILEYMKEKNWVAVLCDSSKSFYISNHIFLVMTKETFAFFDSKNLFDGWMTEVLQ